MLQQSDLQPHREIIETTDKYNQNVGDKNNQVYQKYKHSTYNIDNAVMFGRVPLFSFCPGLLKSPQMVLSVSLGIHIVNTMGQNLAFSILIG